MRVTKVTEDWSEHFCGKYKRSDRAEAISMKSYFEVEVYQLSSSQSINEGDE